MGEEVRMTEYEGCDDGSGGDEDRVLEWEAGLPESDDLTPLTKHLIPLELASAFSISLEPCRTILDVNQASQTTLSNLRGGQSQGFSSSNNFKSFEERGRVDADPMVVGWDETTTNPDCSALDPRKLRKVDTTEEADSALRIENSTEVDPSARTLKRPRLVWTPQLHKRFVDVVAHLDIKNAVPKTIMQLMNVEGLTRENVASHLQKYRLYLKRMQGFSNEGPSASDQLFASTPVPQSLPESSSNGQGTGQLPVSIPMPYGLPHTVAMPLLGMAAASHGHMVGLLGNAGGYPYSMMQPQQQDWSGNKYGSMVSYPHHVGYKNSNDK